MFNLLYTILLITSALILSNSEPQSRNNVPWNLGELVFRQKRAAANRLTEDRSCNRIRELCPGLEENLDDLIVLECLQALNSDLLQSLDKQCQQDIIERRQKLIEDDNIKGLLAGVCKDELRSLNCDGSEQSDSFLVCVLENINAVDHKKCERMVRRIEAVAFSDVRWISNFLRSCKHDIQKYECTQLEKMTKETFWQGNTLACLKKRVVDLEETCKRQVYHLTELQADNIELDKALFESCAMDHLRFCGHLNPRSGLVYKCLIQHIQHEGMSVPCQEQLLQRQKMINQDYKINRGMMRACKEDIRKLHCRRDASEVRNIRLAQILLCLEAGIKNGTKVSPNCEGEMIDHRRLLMEDYRLSPEIVDGCSRDIKRYCSMDVGGRTLHCLMEHAKIKNKKNRVEDVCLRAIEGLIQEADPGEDWRVDPVLREACQPVVDVACKNLKAGNARVLMCLMDNLGTEHMTEACETALVQIQYFVARDFRLDPQMYTNCHEDATRLCHAKRNWWENNDSTNPENAPLVLPCLYRYAYHPQKEMRLKQQCLDQVRRVMRQRALSVDLQPDLEEVCINDLSMMCFKKVKKGEEVQCLQDNLDNLEDKCKIAVVNYTETQAQHVELNPIIMIHCKIAIDRHCSNEFKTGKDEGLVMECLIAHKNDPDMKSDQKCRAAVEHFQLISQKDFHFTYKFKEACKAYVIRYCQDSKTKGSVINCLSERVMNDTLLENRNTISKECRQQMRSQLFQQRENIKFDQNLMSSCKKDIESYCSKVESGESQILECLQTTNHKLQPKCQKAVFKIRKQELTDNSVDYTLVTMCRGMVQHYCPETNPSQILDCLKLYKEDAQFDKKCRLVVIHRLIEQNTDYRFNPTLQAACNMDIGKFCSEIITREPKDSELNGKVIKCLKDKFRESKLSLKCEREMSEVLREQAFNYNLNPLLKSVCRDEINELCKSKEGEEESSGHTEECLKNAFLNKKIITPACKVEVAAMIEESKADIHVDPLLQRACTVDLLRYCGSVQQGGGKHIQCLQWVMDSPDKHLQPECQDMLSKRMEMFVNAAAQVKASPPQDLDELYSQVVSSPAKRYFIIVALTAIGLIFVTGLFCGRVTRRAMIMKKK